ncbi:MAG: hypothetical protein KatS3mg004_0184 [Bryobacteraceae bacterium]|nr:MAG: hypothetical protein KatS3mg004_0184 [Bryobacteraceae bacterium]
MLIGELQQTLSKLDQGEYLLWQILAGGYALLPRALREAIKAAEPDAGLISKLETCYEQLQSSGASQAIQRYWAELKQNDIDADRLHRNACALVATTLASAYARQSPLTRESVAGAEKWAQRAAKLLGGGAEDSLPSSLAEGLSWTNPPSARDLLEQIYARLAEAGWKVTAARRWSLYWLGCDHGERRLQVPVACVVNGQGHLGDLHLEWLADQPRVLVEHPEMALWPIEPSFLETLEQAHLAAGGAVVWRFAFRQPEQLGRIPLRGNSAGGAAAVGFRLLAQGDPYDAGCVIVSGLTLTDCLQAVGDEQAKLQAAARAGLKRAVVAPGTTLDQAAQESLVSSGLQIQSKPNVAEACRFASDLPRWLIAYFEQVAGQADAAAPPYLAGRKPSELYVEPDVLVGVRRAKVRRPGAETAPAAEESSGPRYLPDTVLEVGEQYPYGFEVEQSEERRSWEQARRRLADTDRAAVVLGPPGQGKTQLVRMTARALALEAKAALIEQRESFDRVELPVVVRCQELAGLSSEQELERGLEQLLADKGVDRQTASYVAGQWKQSRCWLFLDGLDEVADPAQLQELWQVLARGECRVVLTSRPYAYRGGLPFRRVEYRLAPLTGKQWRELIGRWYRDDANRAASLLQQIGTSAALEQMAQNPLLVTFVCWVAERHSVTAEMSRSQLYDRIVRDLLAVDRQGTQDLSRAEALLPLVREIAWQWFEQSQGRRALTHERLRGWITKSDHRPLPKGLMVKEVATLAPAQQADAIIEELSREKRLLAAFEHGGYLAYIFPHRSILEYLAAAELVKKLEGMDQERWWKFVDRVAWDPGWENVQVFTAGQLGREANRLVTQLLKGRDDILRHRLALAAVCLSEVPAGIRDKVMANQITRQVWDLCVSASWEVRQLLHVQRAWMVANQLNGEVEGLSSLQKLLAVLKDEDEIARSWAAHTLSTLPEAAARDPRVIAGLLEALKDEDQDVCVQAALALGLLGEAAAQDCRVIPALLEALKDDRGFVRYVAAATMRLLMQAGAQVIPALLEARNDTDWRVRRAAAEALGELGEAAAQDPRVIPALLEMLNDDSEDVCRAAAEALGELREAAAQDPRVIPALLEMPKDERENVLCAVSHALGKFATAAAQGPRLIPALLEMLKDDGEDVCGAAAGALGGLGEAAAQDRRVISALLEARKNGHEIVRMAAAWALGGLGEAAAQDRRVIPALLEALKDTDWHVRGHAAFALGRLGKVATHDPRVIPALVVMLQDERAYVRMAAAWALGELKQAAAQHLQVIPALLATLKGKDEEDEYVRDEAAEALGKLGEVAAQDRQVISALLEALENTHWSVRGAAAEALGRLEEAATQDHRVIPALLKALKDETEIERDKAAKALGKLGEGAARNPGVLADVRKQPLRRPHVLAIVDWDRRGLRIFQDSGGNGLTVRTVEELVHPGA